MATPHISLVIPIYNVAPWLPDCLDSVLAQSFHNWEAILVDDGSTDTSGQIVDAYAARDPRFIAIHQPNSGRGAARNAGCARVRGEYIGFVDGDDMMPPEALEKLFATAQTHNADVVIGDYITFTDGSAPPLTHTTTSDAFETAFLTLPQPFTWQALQGNFSALYMDIPLCVVWGKLFRTALWRSCNSDSPGALQLSEDFISTKKMVFSASRIAACKTISLLYRKRAGSATTRRSADSFHVFQAHKYAAHMFQDTDVWKAERNNIYRFFLLTMHLHMVRITPYHLWPAFYRRAAQTVNKWPQNLPLPKAESQMLKLYHQNTLPALTWLSLRYWLAGRILVAVKVRKDTE